MTSGGAIACYPHSPSSMTHSNPHALSVAMLASIGTIAPNLDRALAATPLQAPQLLSSSPLFIAQTPEELRQQQLEQQREAERVLKEGERLRREIRQENSNYGGRGDLEQRINESVTKVRESGRDSQRVREANTEIDRIRSENNNRQRPYYYYNPYYYYPYGSSQYYYYRTVPGTVIINTPVYPNPNFTPGGGDNYEYNVPQRPATRPSDRAEQDREPTVKNRTQVMVSAAFKDGQTSPGIGIRFNNIGLEIAGIFNQDRLPGALNDFALPNNFLQTDLGVRKLSGQWGGDILGFFDLNSQVSLYGGVGLYFQSQGRISQSQATNELYKQTDESTISTAVSGGVTYNLSESFSLGAGYHSIRGLTTRIGISF
jgi:hypothetical protein